MASNINGRLLRFALSAVGIITVSAIFTAYHLSPISWSAVLPTRAPSTSSSLSVSTSTLPSGWLSDDGYLEFAASSAWGTRYTLLQGDADGYTCDELEVLADGRAVCRNTISALRSLWSNTQAQQRYLALGETGEGAAVTGLEGGLAGEFSETYHNISSLAGKRILVIGDSVDRNWITELVDLTAPSSYFRNYDLSSYIRPPAARAVDASSTSGDAQSTSAHTICERAIGFKFECGTAIIPIASSPHLSSNDAVIGKSFTAPFTRDLAQAHQQLRIDLAFAFGVMNEGGKPTLPGDTSDRVAALRQVIGGGVEDHETSNYDAITINFGLWDLVGFQRRAYLATSTDTEPGLTVEWVAEYSETCERFIESLRDTYGPHTPIYFRLVHVTGLGVDVNRGLLGLPPHLHTVAEAEAAPTFRPLRVAQLRRAQMSLAKRMGLKTINFAKLFEGHGTEITTDGTHPLPQADKVYAELVLRQVMSECRRE